MRKVKLTITGKVHNVGYRPFLLDLAESLFIERFDARNVLIKGKQAVVVLVEGDDEQINQFVELVKKEKPEKAVVEDVKVEEYEGFIRSIDSYRQSLMVNQLNKIVQVGLKMLEKQDETIKVIKEESEKTREYLSKVIREESEKTRDYLSMVIREESEKTREEIRELRVDLKSYLDERLKRIEAEIEKIKAKLGMA